VRDVPRGDHVAAGLLGGLDGHLCALLRCQALRIFVAQLFQASHAVLVAMPPRLDALADPDFLFIELLVEQPVGGGFVFEQLFLAFQILVVTAGKAQQPAAVQFADARGELVEEGAVVGDEQHGARPGADAVFQPLDGDDIEVVGGFVEQQQVGLADQRLGEAHPAAPATGQFADWLFGGQGHLGDHQVDALVDAPAVEFVDAVLQLVEAGKALLVELLVRELLVLVDQRADIGEAVGDHFTHGGFEGFGQFLRERADHQAVAVLERAAVRLRGAGDQAEQGGLAGAIAADQADAFTGVDFEINAGQQLLLAVGKRDLIEAYE
jgi:hypothetical protein